MMILKEIPTIPEWQFIGALILAIVAVLFLAVGVMSIKEWSFYGSFSWSGIIMVVLSLAVLVCFYMVIFSYGDYGISNSMSKDVVRYEITIDDNKVSSDTLEKIQKNYEIVEKNKIGYITKAIVEGPKYETIFSESEIAKMSP